MVAFLSPGGQSQWEIRIHLLCVCAVLACVGLSHFYINLYVSFISEDIFTRFAENVYGCENMSVKHFALVLKRKMAAIALICSKVKILQVALSLCQFFRKCKWLEKLAIE